MNRRRICFALISLVAAVIADPTRADAADVPDSVVIKVGQELFVSFTANGDNLVSPKTLPDAKGPDPTVTIQLTQSGPTRTLFPAALLTGLDTAAQCPRVPIGDEQVELPVSSVRSGLQSVMSLSEPFDELVLFEFHLQG